MMINIKIKPVDVLFFRDSKPFGRGNEHFTKSLFPPFSRTLYGALKASILENLDCDFEEFRRGSLVFRNRELMEKFGGVEKIEEEIGTVDTYGNFILKGPFLLYKDEKDEEDEKIYLKLPADVKRVGDEKSWEYKVLQPFNWDGLGITTDFDKLNNYPHIITEEPVKDKVGYISLENFVNCYILGKEIKSSSIKEPNEIFSYEMRVGIGVDSKTNVTGEGLLYMMGFVRLNDGWSLHARTENLSLLSDSGLIKFGGANRVCEYSKLPDDPFKRGFSKENVDAIKEVIKESGKFKIILLSPALFKYGWISEKLDSNWEMQIGQVRVKMLSAVVDRAVNISGWDLAKNRARPLRKLVPAGSVYYFELLEGSVDELFKNLNFINFSDENSNLGFGTTMIGGIKNV